MRIAFTLIILFAYTASAFSQQKSTYEIGDSLLQLGKFTEAIAFYDKALGEDPLHEKAYRGRGFTYLQLHKYAKARADYKMALEINQKCARCYMNLALIEIGEYPERLKEAIALSDKSIAIDPNDAVLYESRGELREAAGDKTGAFMDFNKAVNLDPDDPQIMLARARHQVRSGYDALALADLNKILEINPNHMDAMYERAKLCINRGHYDAALADITKGLSIDPLNNAFRYAQAFILFHSGEFEASKKEYDRLVSSENENPDYYYGRAGACYKLEDMDGACVDYKKSLDILMRTDPASDWIPLIKTQLENICDDSRYSFYYHRGIANFNLGKFDTAVRYYDLGLQKFPNSPLLLNFKGNALLRLEKYTEAVSTYELVLSMKDKLEEEVGGIPRIDNVPTDSQRAYIGAFIAELYYNLAEARFNLNDFAGALDDINKGIRSVPSGFEEVFPAGYFHNIHGLVYMAMNKYQEALKEFEAALSITQDAPQIYVNRAVALANLDNKFRMRSVKLSVNNASPNSFSNTLMTFPLDAKVRSNDKNLHLAINDCATAIRLDPSYAYAFYVSAQLKYFLGKPDFCMDMYKAKDLGMPKTEEFLDSYCK